jgi:hypothetical protein
VSDALHAPPAKRPSLGGVVNGAVARCLRLAAAAAAPPASAPLLIYCYQKMRQAAGARRRAAATWGYRGAGSGNHIKSSARKASAPTSRDPCARREVRPKQRRNLRAKSARPEQR